MTFAVWTDVVAERTRAVCSRRPNLGHRVLYPGTIDRRRSALDDVTTLAVVKGAFKLDYGCFFCVGGTETKHSRRESVQAGSTRVSGASSKGLEVGSGTRG